MDAFVRKFCEKYSLPITVSLQLLEKMEKFSFRKEIFWCRRGNGIRFLYYKQGNLAGHYLNDGQMSPFGLLPRERRFFVLGLHRKYSFIGFHRGHV